jgi:hypothetical protein
VVREGSLVATEPLERSRSISVAREGSVVADVDPVAPVVSIEGDVLEYVESLDGELVAEVLGSMEEEVDWSTITGGVAAVVVVSVSVLEDLVVLLQPLRANPARIKANKTEVFIGGLSCAPTDPALSDRFAEVLEPKIARM